MNTWYWKGKKTSGSAFIPCIRQGYLVLERMNLSVLFPPFIAAADAFVMGSKPECCSGAALVLVVWILSLFKQGV